MELKKEPFQKTSSSIDEAQLKLNDILKNKFNILDSQITELDNYVRDIPRFSYLNLNLLAITLNYLVMIMNQYNYKNFKDLKNYSPTPEDFNNYINKDDLLPEEICLTKKLGKLSNRDKQIITIKAKTNIIRYLYLIINNLTDN